MGRPTRLTQAKRNREFAQKERAQEKQEQRAIRKQEREGRTERIKQGFDPDLEGIVPGPHNNPGERV
jgi:hypothetical protein